MSEKREHDFLLLRNLNDAGCDAETTKEFLQHQCNGNGSAQLRLLIQHRRRLLEMLHESQNRIDCLDYLIYRMKQQNGVMK